MLSTCSGHFCKGSFAQSQQNKSGFMCRFTGTLVTNLLTLCTGCGASGDPCRACCPPAGSWRWGILPPSLPFLHCFSLFPCFLAVKYVLVLPAACHLDGICELPLLQCKFVRGKWCWLYCFPTPQGGKATWVSEQNSRLKFNLCYLFSSSCELCR